MVKKGYFVISLDFELLWGVFDKVDYKEKKEYFETTRTIIPGILSLFSQYNIHCTWATVGMLFNETWADWKNNIPDIIPDYGNRNLSAYHYGENLLPTGNEFYCLARELVQEIKNTPNQEIGTHTYSHYYSLEPGQTLEAFKSDLMKAVELASQMDIDLRSLVFPRNQFNENYLSICQEFGIENVRSNPEAWYWENTEKNSMLHRIFRTGDAYFGRNNKSYRLSASAVQEGKPLIQKASRLLRPHSKIGLLNRLKLNRIKSEMTKAAKNKEIYHLWWHPHNFGTHPQENMGDLEYILEHYKYCEKTFGFESASMSDINSILHE